MSNIPPCEGTDISIHYISYTNLPIVSERDISILLIKELTNIILESENFLWQEHFQVITKLRILHKNIPGLFYIIFNVIYKKLKRILNDSPHKLTKNILFLFIEIFSNYYDESSVEFQYIIKYLSSFLPIILKKYSVISNNNPLRELYEECLSTIGNNMLYFDVVLILLDIIKNNNRNFNLRNTAYNMVSCLLQNFHLCYFIERSQEDQSEIADRINSLYEMGSNFNIKLCYQIVGIFIENNIDIGKYLNNRNIIENIMNYNKNNEEKSKTRRSLIKNIETIQRDKINYAFKLK